MSKRMVSLFLSTVMFVVCSFGATATYAAENIETAIIDGKEYRCESRIVDDKEYMYITNITDEITDVVYYDVCSGIIFHNGKPVAYVENAVSFPDEKSIESVSPLATTGWRYHDTSNHRISWARGVAAATLAGIIAAVIPSTGWLSVLTKIGATALSAVSAACIGGNVKCVAYTQVLASGKVQCRYDWTFRPSSGESYGPYSSYKL